MIRPGLACILTFLIIGVCPAQTPDCKLVPGWQQQDEARSFDADNLFEYVDGNAEGYLIYGFLKMNGVSCKSGGTSFAIDVSEMADSESAYGLFLSNRDPRLPVEKIGMQAQIQPRRGIFAKDRYFVEIAANPAGDHSANLRAFLTAMDRRMSGQTALPEALAWFPAEKLDANSFRLVPQSVLGLGLLKRGYVAQYDYGKAFVVTEASPAAAAAVIEKAKARFGQTQPVEVGDEAFQATDKYLGRLCFFRKGRYVAGFANLTRSTDLVAMAKVLAASIP